MICVLYPNCRFSIHVVADMYRKSPFVIHVSSAPSRRLHHHGESSRMNNELVQAVVSTFQSQAQKIGGGMKYWIANASGYLLGYAEWRVFNSMAISKVKTARVVRGHGVSDHFVDVNKTIDLSRAHARRIARSITSRAIDAPVGTGYRCQHIRPLAVRPLNHPEREPTPWGFLFSTFEKSNRQPVLGVLA